MFPRRADSMNRRQQQMRHGHSHADPYVATYAGQIQDTHMSACSCAMFCRRTLPCQHTSHTQQGFDPSVLEGFCGTDTLFAGCIGVLAADRPPAGYPALPRLEHGRRGPSLLAGLPALRPLAPQDSLHHPQCRLRHGPPGVCRTPLPALHHGLPKLCL